MPEHAALVRITTKGISVEISGSEAFVQEQLAAQSGALQAKHEEAIEAAKDRMQTESAVLAAMSSLLKTLHDQRASIISNIR